ncbi:hypothetical protein EHM82_02035 [bacterium]|nr:MAG: hypothetical protein EHM82_02035 [bacterium]
MKRAALLLLTLVLATTVAAPSLATPDCKKDKDGICPMYYSPVICDHGKIYSNPCFARLDCAENCLPYFEPL